jgi:hypothetical protein
MHDKSDNNVRSTEPQRQVNSSLYGQPAAYKIVITKHVLALTKAEQANAIQAGKGDQFRAAVRQIVERLRKDPLVFGEPLYDYPALQVVVRQAVLSPAAVTDAVHEQQRAVSVQRFSFL